MRYLLDTCVLSEPGRPSPDAGVLEWLDGVAEANLFISVLSLGEIQQGISRLEQGRRRQALQRWLDVELVDRFEGQVIGFDVRTAARWGDIMGRARLAGNTLPVIDAMLAASALVHDVVLVTRNVRDFDWIVGSTHLEVFSPWS